MFKKWLQIELAGCVTVFSKHFISRWMFLELFVVIKTISVKVYLQEEQKNKCFCSGVNREGSGSVEPNVHTLLCCSGHD